MINKIKKWLGAKSLTDMRFPGRSFVFFSAVKPDDGVIRSEVGNGLDANILMTPIRWLQRSFVESRPVVKRGEDVVDGHEIINLLARPNGFYAGEHLWAGTILSLCLDGNAYWVVVRNGRGRVAELWYVPHWLIEPRWPDDGSVFISHYKYTASGREMKLETSDVVHFRDGIDPENIRRGLSPLGSLIREVWTDQEAALFSASMLRNGGIPGVVISPDGDGVIQQEEAVAVKEYFDSQFTRANRGKPVVLSGRTKVDQFGFSPQQLDMSALRNISEERVAAALGVPAAVVGFGTGLEQTRVGATLRELRRLAWENGVIPLQRVVAAQITSSLLPQGETLAFDTSEVTALQEDETARVERVARLVSAGVWTRAEAREATGVEARPEDDVFLIPISMIVTPRGGFQRPAEAPSGKSIKAASLLDERLIESAPRVRSIPAVVERFAKIMDRIGRDMPALMKRELVEFFCRLGRDGKLLIERYLPEEYKQSAQEGLFVGQVMEGLAMADRLPIFQQIFERHYLRVSEEVVLGMESVYGLEIGMPDPLARAVVAAGGRRAGLIDIEEQTKRALFDRLTWGRAAGLGGQNLADYIVEGLPAGPWTTPEIRAMVIARTETVYALNVASALAAKDAGVGHVIVLDNRTGFDDDVCPPRNGMIVTVEEGEALLPVEHPNGTMQLCPLPPGLYEEMRAGGRVQESGGVSRMITGD